MGQRDLAADRVAGKNRGAYPVFLLRPACGLQPSTTVQVASARWKIEQDYQQLKEELGLDHYERAVGAVGTTT